MADKANPSNSRRTKDSDKSEMRVSTKSPTADNTKRVRTSNESEEKRETGDDKNTVDKHRTSDEKKEQVKQRRVHNKENSTVDPMEQTDAPAGAEETKKQTGEGTPGNETGDMIDVFKFLPPEAIKTVKLLKNKRHRHRGKEKENPENDKPGLGPIASKVIYLKKPAEPAPKEEEPEVEPPEEPQQIQIEEPQPPPGTDPDVYENVNYPMFLFGDTVENLLRDKREDLEIEKKLNDLIDAHRGDKLRKLKNAAKAHAPKYKFGEMITTLTKLGIPCPTNEDFEKLHGLHSRWDPDGTIIEYFSPMLRTFVPINMRGRYRGCWPTDTCMKGLNISKVQPKRDALEGFIERGRHDNIQKKYDEMSQVAVDEAHLDFLIQVQAYQAETLPIPIFYDMLHLGFETANETLRILVQEEGYPPNNYIFVSALKHAEQIRRKIQLYGSLGLESLDSKRKGLGAFLPQWLKSRDEIIRDILKSKDGERYKNLIKMETEGKERENVRHEQMGAEKPMTSARKSNLSTLMKKMTGNLNKVEPGPKKLEKNK